MRTFKSLSNLLAIGAGLSASVSGTTVVFAQGTPTTNVPTVSIAQFKAVALPARIAARASKPVPISSLPNIARFSPRSGRAISRGVGGLSIPDTSLKGSTSVDQWFDRLPDWGLQNKPKKDDKEVGEPSSTKETQNGRPYTVTKTDYSITETPDEIVTFAPVNGFWLGGLVQEDGLREGLGSLQEIAIPATKRATMNVSTDLPMGGNFRVIKNPSATQSSSAIGDLMQKGNKIQWGGARTLKIVENYSEEQTAHQLGLDARYAIASIKASFSTERFGSQHTVTAAFTEKAFTAQADFEGRTRREAFFSPAFTVTDARNLVIQKKVTPSNLPAYIKSITYGRVLLFNLTSTLSESQMRGALEASVNGGSWAVNASYEGSQAAKNASFEMRVTTLGGPQGGFTQLIPAKGMADVLAIMKSYLSEKAPLSTMMPISYTANTLREDRLAELTTTTKYTVTKYVANPIGERYRLKMWVDVYKTPDDGVADNTYESYGNLRVNGDTWWELPNRGKASAKHGLNAVVKISEDEANSKKEFTYNYYYDKTNKFDFALLLMDWDRVSSNDTWMKVEGSIDLRKYEGKKYTVQNGSGRLTIMVERTDYL
ncbi:hypothetical protein EON83_21635 [bacterium]|nr:MAG: hypothetical protein EON83_21635 [bacterium]